MIGIKVRIKKKIFVLLPVIPVPERESVFSAIVDVVSNNKIILIQIPTQGGNDCPAGSF